MSSDHREPLSLTPEQRQAILELGARGAGGEFDQMALSQLFVLGLIEVHTADRRLALTERGRSTYEWLTGGKSAAR